MTPTTVSRDDLDSFSRETFPHDDPRHGTPNGYSNLRCRCDRCRHANALRVAERKLRTPDLDVARTARQRAGRLPRSAPPEMLERFTAERVEMAMRHAAEMNEMLDRQIAEGRAVHTIPRLTERLAKAEARAAKIRAELDSVNANGTLS